MTKLEDAYREFARAHGDEFHTVVAPSRTCFMAGAAAMAEILGVSAVGIVEELQSVREILHPQAQPVSGTSQWVRKTCWVSGPGGICRMERGHSGAHEFT